MEGVTLRLLKVSAPWRFDFFQKITFYFVKLCHFQKKKQWVKSGDSFVFGGVTLGLLTGPVPPTSELTSPALKNTLTKENFIGKTLTK